MPKVLIDIPDHTYDECKKVELTEALEGVIFHAIKAIANGTPLPEDFSLENYERYKKDSENLSWLRCPERMGN